MGKVLINVYLPSALKSYDVMVPADMRLCQAAKLIAGTLSQISGSLYSEGSVPTLCDRITGDILNINMSVWELGLRNGSQLMLV